MTERDHSHTSAPQRHDELDDVAAPGRASRSSQLDAPAQPVPSGLAVAGASTWIGAAPIDARPGNAHESTLPYPKDMSVVDWRVCAPIAPPEAPQPRAISIAAAPPLPAGVAHDPSTGDPTYAPPGHLRPKYPLTVFDVRRTAWTSLTSSARSLENIHNTAAPSISTFNNASKDPVLTSLYELQQDGTDGLSLHQVANRQVVPRTNASGTTVGGLFRNVVGVSVGTDANTSGLGDHLQRASSSAAVEQAITALRGKDAALAATVEGMSVAQSEASAAGHTLAATNFSVDEVRATEVREDAEAQQAALAAKAAEVKKYVGYALKGIALLGGLASGPGAAAVGGMFVIDGIPGLQGAYKPSDPTPPTATQSAGSAVKSVGDSAASSAVAEKIVGYVFQADIDKQIRNISTATTQYRSARKGVATESWLAATDTLAAGLSGIKKAANEMKAKLMERKAAYRTLAEAAAAAGGGSPEEQDRIRALIMAIPIAKAVVSQASNILNVVSSQPLYDEASGVGYHMALGTGQPTAAQVTDTYATILGYREHFDHLHRVWSKRVVSLEGVIGSLEGKKR